MRPRRGGLIARDRIDWQAERDRIDLAGVATRLLGAPGRRGGRGLWWRCPFHEDANPSFTIHDREGRQRWKCFGCGEHGDAPALAMKLGGMTFPEAVRFLTGGHAPSGSRSLQSPKTRPTPEVKPERRSEGMPEADALALVGAAAARLWVPEGAEALAYLRGRGLADATIRAAMLGWAPRIEARTRDGRPYTASGLIIPWHSGDRLALVKVRQPEGRRPKYVETFRNPDRPPTLFPSPETIRPGRPAILTEGEFDALLLGQALGELAAVVTLGSASGRPAPDILTALSAAPAWYIATDADGAGDRAAASWGGYARARRIRPPEPFKDWTEAGTDLPGTTGTALDLARWWGAILSGNEAPPLFTWDDLASWRWGPSLDDPTPGIDARGPAVAVAQPTGDQ